MNFTNHDIIVIAHVLSILIYDFTSTVGMLSVRIQMLDYDAHLSAGEIDGSGNRATRVHRQ